jgi:hypothetical protein
MMGRASVAATAVVALLSAAALAGCASSRPEPPPEAAAAPPPPPPPPTPPPTDLNGRWRLTVAGNGACFMKFGNGPAAADRTIAPEGGCPGSFYTSRKWSFERGMLVVRDHKGEALAELSFAGGRFEGTQTGGGAVSLSRQ